MTMEAHGKAAQTTLPCSSQGLRKESTKQWSLITVDKVGDVALQLKAWTTHFSRGPRFSVQGPALMSCDLQSLITPVPVDLYP